MCWTISCPRFTLRQNVYPSCFVVLFLNLMSFIRTVIFHICSSTFLPQHHCARCVNAKAELWTKNYVLILFFFIRFECRKSNGIAIPCRLVNSTRAVQTYTRTKNAPDDHFRNDSFSLIVYQFDEVIVIDFSRCMVEIWRECAQVLLLMCFKNMQHPGFNSNRNINFHDQHRPPVTGERMETNLSRALNFFLIFGSFLFCRDIFNFETFQIR